MKAENDSNVIYNDAELKTGLYECLVTGNAFEYYQGDDFGHDVDADEDMPLDFLISCGVVFIRELD